MEPQTRQSTLGIPLESDKKKNRCHAQQMLLFYQSLQKGGFLNQEGQQSIILLWLDDCGEKDIPQLK